MHDTLSADFFINIFAAVMMPVIIWANLRNSGIKSPLNAYLWREHPNFMRVALVVLAFVSVFAAVSLLADFGIISSATEETGAMIVGVPFLVVAVVMLWLTGAALLKVARQWRGGTLHL
jgi:hypothetical protein